MGETKEFIRSKNGEYEIVRKLGEGYTGEVYLVNDLKKGKPVALKLLNPEAFKEGQLEAFKREFMLLCDLHHPHVCRVYDFGLDEERKRYFFSLELIQGTDLYSYTEKLSIGEIEELFIQIADALGIIHSAGLIHYDIKGDNILVTMTEGRPLAKIVDFGLATPSVEVPENIAGTVRYISPEMISKSQTIDYRADLYSLGIVLYRMLAGRYPEQGSTMKDVLKWHINHTSLETVPLLDRGVPPYLIEVIEKLTRRIPSERFSSAAVLIRYIELHSGRTYGKTQKKLVATLMEEGPLVARDKIMFTIRSSLSRLGKKEPLREEDHQILAITGSAGSGKSRLLKEAGYIAQLSELDTYIINPEAGGSSFESFRETVKCHADDEKALVDQLISKEPFCLMVDDIDRCARKVRDLIGAVASSLYSSRFLGRPRKVMMIVTMQADSPEQAMPVHLNLDVDREHLAPFTAEDITQYLRLSLGESNPASKQVKDILKFSGGIPELVKAAIASLESPTARMKEDAEHLFASRMKNLDAPSKLVIGYVALADKPLTQEDLIVLTGKTIESSIYGLVKEGLVIFDRAGEKYRAGTDAVVIAAEKIFSEDEKKEMAKTLLGYFESTEPDDLDSLVKYASMGDDRNKAADYIIKAGEKKEKTSEIEDAYQYYERALLLLDKNDSRYPLIHRKLAKEHLFKGEHKDATDHIKTASSIAGETVDDLTSRSWIDRLKHKPDDALKLIEEAIVKTEAAKGSPEHLKLLNEKAQCFVQMGMISDAVKLFSETDAAARLLADDDRKKVVNNNLGIALSITQNFDTAIKFYTEKLDFFKDDRQLSASILSQLGYVYQQAGILSNALDAFIKSWEIYSAIGDLHSSLAILGNIVSICQSKARFTDALNYVNESIRVAAQSGSERDLASNYLTLGSLYVTLGLEDVAKRYLNEATAIFQNLKDDYMEAWSQITFAYLHKNLVKHKQAQAYLDNAIKIGKKLKKDDLVLWGSYGASDMLLGLGETEKAKKYFENIESMLKGLKNSAETNIKIDLLRCRLEIASSDKPPAGVEKRLAELSEKAKDLEFRELEGEIFHAIGEYHQKLGDTIASAKNVAAAKEIIEDIAHSLSEEYRESFLKQQFRQKVFEDSVKLSDIISQSFGEKDLPDEFKPKKKEAEIKEKEARTKEPTVDISADIQRIQETSILDGGRKKS